MSLVIGYAKVVKPDHAFIVSPKGWADSLQRFVRDYKRVDVLEYAPNRRIVVARWDIPSNSIRCGEVLLEGWA